MSDKPIRSRVTKEEKMERIQMIVECLMVTDSTTTVIRSIVNQFNIKQRMAFAYLHEARKYLTCHLNVNAGSHLGLAIKRTKYLYTLSVSKKGRSPQDVRNAMEAIRLEKDLLMDHEKIKFLQKGKEKHGNTLENNPLLARLKELEGGTQ